MTIDPYRLASEMKSRFPDVLFAYLFGSAQSGTLRAGGDVDIAVWISDITRRMEMIPELIGLVESFAGGAPCDLIFLNDAGDLLSFEALQGTILFIREEARDHHAWFYSRTCREYEDKLAFMNKQLNYRGYEVQWDH